MEKYTYEFIYKYNLKIDICINKGMCECLEKCVLVQLILQ